MTCRHFLSLFDLDSTELAGVIQRAIELRKLHYKGQSYQPMKGQVMGMIFEKSSTRTRVSFEAGMAQFGGHAIFLSPRDTQLGRGEPIEDTARVLSSMCDVIAIRTFSQEKLELFSANSMVPVINALTDFLHPCQLLADLQTFVEARGSIEGREVAWIGDGNNMCHSYIEAAVQCGFKLRIASPEGYHPDAALLARGGDSITLTDDPHEAAAGADLVTTDVWASMGQEQEQKARESAFQRFQVDDSVMAKADEDALFLHCLPAHRGEEVSASVINGPQSAVWSQAENRLHAQKALLEFLLC